jgi:threonine/homoserine/homoserine lactone efflux protein
MQGVFSSVTNTKTLVLFVSFLPQFMEPQQAIAPQFVVLGAIYAGLTLAIYGVIGSLAGWAGSWLQRPLVQRIMRGSAGVVIAGLGVWGMVG